MLDPNNAEFQVSEMPEVNKLLVVAILSATQSLTLDLGKFKATPNQPGLVWESKRALVIGLWQQAYGKLGGIIEHLHRTAEESGDLRYLSPLKDARQLLRPQWQTEDTGAVPMPAPEGDGAAEREGKPTYEELVKLLTEWATDRVPRLPVECDMMIALWKIQGDRTEPCPGCDGDCGEPCAPVKAAVAIADLERLKLSHEIGINHPRLE